MWVILLRTQGVVENTNKLIKQYILENLNTNLLNYSDLIEIYSKLT